jgi:hypothetical protein
MGADACVVAFGAAGAVFCGLGIDELSDDCIEPVTGPSASAGEFTTIDATIIPVAKNGRYTIPIFSLRVKRDK